MPGPSFVGMDESDMEKYLVRNVEIGSSGGDVKGKVPPIDLILNSFSFTSLRRKTYFMIASISLKFISPFGNIFRQLGFFFHFCPNDRMTRC